MRIFVLGGTGSIGVPLVRCLVRRGHHVTGLARSAASADRLRASGAEPVSGDITDPEGWIEALDHADGVIHAADTFDDDMAGIDRRLTAAMIARLGSRPEPVGLLCTGGCWLFGDTGGDVIDESVPFDTIDAFDWMVDTIPEVLNAENVNGMILHPAMVYDGVGGVFEQFSDAARSGGPVPVTGSAETYWPLVHVEDLAELYALMVEHPRRGAQYHGSAIDGVRVGDIAGAVARRFGISENLRIVPVEEDVAALGAWAVGRTLSQRITGALAMRELGWTPRHLDVFADIAGAEI